MGTTSSNPSADSSLYCSKSEKVSSSNARGCFQASDDFAARFAQKKETERNVYFRSSISQQNNRFGECTAQSTTQQEKRIPFPQGEQQSYAFQAKSSAVTNCSRGSSSSNYPHPLYVKAVCKDRPPPPPLQLMERVVLVTDNGPEFGQVKWLGKLPDVDRGWIAGVEFDNPIGSGSGTYKKHRLFTAKINHASLIPIFGLMKADAFFRDSSAASSCNYPHQLSVEAVWKDGTPPPPLQLMERVVFVTDNGPEFGQVKWLGKLPDVDRGWIAGVEFDNPIGSGSGTYQNYRLFNTKMNHASLIPVFGLMKADAFLRDSDGASSSNYPHPLSVKAVCKDRTPPPPVQLMERVVFFSDDGPEFGQVKWIGKLPDVARGWIAGVEFDNPIGAGTGTYYDYRLFTAKMNHASLIPIVALTKADVFLTDSSEQLEDKKSDDDINSSKNGFCCPVCLVPVAELCSSETVIVSTVCGHIFCEPCIDKILESNNECPNCRTKIYKIQNRKLYF